MRVGVIGCGFFAQNHLNSWRDLAGEGVEIAAVCDIDAKKAEAAAKAFGVAKFYADAATMLESETLDFVDVVTRMETHCEIVKLAAAKRVDIILQKPIAADWNGAKAVVETARQAGVRLAIHENFRWQSPMRKLKGVLDGGALGKPTWARIAFRTGYDIYAVQPYLHQAERAQRRPPRSWNTRYASTDWSPSAACCVIQLPSLNRCTPVPEATHSAPSGAMLKLRTLPRPPRSRPQAPALYARTLSRPPAMGSPEASWPIAKTPLSVKP